MAIKWNNLSRNQQQYARRLWEKLVAAGVTDMSVTKVGGDLDAAEEALRKAVQGAAEAEAEAEAEENVSLPDGVTETARAEWLRIIADATTAGPAAAIAASQEPYPREGNTDVWNITTGVTATGVTLKASAAYVGQDGKGTAGRVLEHYIPMDMPHPLGSDGVFDLDLAQLYWGRRVMYRRDLEVMAQETDYPELGDLLHALSLPSRNNAVAWVVTPRGAVTDDSEDDPAWGLTREINISHTVDGLYTMSGQIVVWEDWSQDRRDLRWSASASHVGTVTVTRPGGAVTFSGTKVGALVAEVYFNSGLPAGLAMEMLAEPEPEWYATARGDLAGLAGDAGAPSCVLVWIAAADRAKVVDAAEKVCRFAGVEPGVDGWADAVAAAAAHPVDREILWEDISRIVHPEG